MVDKLEFNLNWCVDAAVAQELNKDYGFELGLARYTQSHELAGDYYIDFGRNRLIAHDMMHRKPSISLTVEKVLSMKLIASLEAREAYAKYFFNSKTYAS